MDECSLAYHQTGIRGTVLRTQPLRSVRPEDRARLGDRRGNITYMASICNDPSFSNVLPQILLGNCQRFAKRVEAKPSRQFVLVARKECLEQSLPNEEVYKVAASMLG